MYTHLKHRYQLTGMVAPSIEPERLYMSNEATMKKKKIPELERVKKHLTLFLSFCSSRHKSNRKLNDFRFNSLDI